MSIFLLHWSETIFDAVLQRAGTRDERGKIVYDLEKQFDFTRFDYCSSPVQPVQQKHLHAIFYARMYKRYRDKIFKFRPSFNN